MNLRRREKVSTADRIISCKEEYLIHASSCLRHKFGLVVIPAGSLLLLPAALSNDLGSYITQKSKNQVRVMIAGPADPVLSSIYAWILMPNGIRICLLGFANGKGIAWRPTLLSSGEIEARRK